MENYSSNSNKAKKAAQESKEVEKARTVEPVVKHNVTTKKKSPGKKFIDSFVSEDVSNVKTYILDDVLLPALKSTISDMITNGIEMMLYGEASGRGGRRNYSGYSTKSRVSYEKYSGSKRSENYRAATRGPRYDFDDVIFESRGDAQEVLDTLVDIIDEYDIVSVADMFEASGMPYQYTDNKWGWDDLRGTTVKRVNGGFLLTLPRPIQID